MPAIVTRRSNGEYSTTVLPDGTIETCWFGDDGRSEVVDRTSPVSLAGAAVKHIANDNKRR